VEKLLRSSNWVTWRTNNPHPSPSHPFQPGVFDFSTVNVNSGTTLYGVGEGGKIYFPLFKLAKCQRCPLGKVSELVLLPIVGNCIVHNIAVNFPMNYTT